MQDKSEIIHLIEELRFLTRLLSVEISYIKRGQLLREIDKVLKKLRSKVIDY